MSIDKQTPKFVVIGGGTGSFTVLSSLKNYAWDITSIVSMADSGGSTGVLRDELGVLPPGDIRQCLVALSDSSDTLRDLFNYRFPSGTFAGHSFGNLFLSGVESMTGDFGEAVRVAGEVLNLKGQVLPMTLDNVQLELKLPGQVITGEHLILDAPIKRSWHPEISLKPAAKINPNAEAAILAADVVVIAPGNLYSSLGACLIVDGVRQALEQTSAKIVFVSNLVNKPHQTAGFGVHDYADEVERFIGAPVLDYVLYNIDEPSPELLKKYALKGELPVKVVPAKLARAHYRAKAGNFLSHAALKSDANDTLMKTIKNARSLIRHDADSVARALMRIYFL